MLRAENAAVVIHPDDRKYGALLVGGQGTGKTSALLTFFKNDVECEDTAPIVIDPKSELARVCLRRTPPDCGKRVWFLDLGHPAFGMNPLRLIGDRPLAIEAAQIAENIVAALLDINENQIYQSSRRYLNHAVIGAIAIAFQEKRRAKLEDVYTLLRPARDDFRAIVAEACATEPDLDQTAEFFRSELPDDLRMSPGRVAERMDAPRNKISGLMGVPPLRRFFNHPTDIPLREIIEARDILIVDANMAAIGTENSKACMLFILRMLNAQLQRQVHQPERDRPRVPLLVDEAHYVLGAESVVDQIATHRAGGLEAAFGVQYLAQLGSGSEHQEKILKGVLNLLQSRFLFRMGDAQDAEETSRIAMAVYATMIRDDPDSRARLRVTPEQLLNFPNYFCLASWIANGNRAPAFTGETFALPAIDDVWADYHLAAQAERVGPYPEHLESTLDTHASEAPEVETDSRRRTALRGNPGASTCTCPTQRRTPPNGWGPAGTPAPSAGTSPPAAIPSPSRAGARRRPRRIRNPSRARPNRIHERTSPWPSRRGRHDRPAPTNGGAPHRTSQPRGAPPAPQARGARRLRATAAPAQARRQPGPPRGGTPGTRRSSRGPRGARARQPARARVLGPDQRDRPARAAPWSGETAAPIRRGLRNPGAARPRRTGAADHDRKGMPARTGADCSARPDGQAAPARADRPTSRRHSRACPRGRQAAAAVLADATRDGGRADPRAAGHLPPARVAAGRAGPRPAARPRPARAGVGDRTAQARRARRRPTTGALPGMPPAATRSRRPARGATGIRSASTRSRSPTSRRSATSRSSSSPRSSPTCRWNCGSPRSG